MDPTHIFTPAFFAVEVSNCMDPTETFFSGLLNIIFINITLSGSNAVVIAMAVRSLPMKERRLGIIFGTWGAVLLRIGLTFIAARLLEISFVKLAGGLLIFWIVFKLLFPEAEEEDTKEIHGLSQVIITILMADLVMSLDNVLGVAGAAKGDLFFLLIGLATSVPIVVFASSIITKFMDRFPVIVLVGVAVLGRVAGEMIMSDPWLIRLMGGHPNRFLDYVVQTFLAIGGVAAAKIWIRSRISPGSSSYYSE